MVVVVPSDKRTMDRPLSSSRTDGLPSQRPDHWCGWCVHEDSTRPGVGVIAHDTACRMWVNSNTAIRPIGQARVEGPATMSNSHPIRSSYSVMMLRLQPHLRRSHRHSHGLYGALKRTCIVTSSSVPMSRVEQAYQRDAIGIVKIDGLRPFMVHDIGDGNDTQQLCTLQLQGCTSRPQRQNDKTTWDAQPRH